MEGRDFSQSDLACIYTLASHANPFPAVAPDWMGFATQTFVWPAIPVTCIFRAAPPAAPAPISPPAQAMRSFICRVATHRREMDRCMAGLYHACDLVSSRSVVYQQGQDEEDAIDVFAAVTPWHECSGRHNLPEPVDYNILYRLLATPDWNNEPDLSAEFADSLALP